MITLLRILNDEPYGNGFQEVRRWQLRLPFLEVLLEVEQKLIPASLERLVREQRLGGSPVLGRRDGLDRAIRVALQNREIAPHAGARRAVERVDRVHRQPGAQAALRGGRRRKR